MKRLIFMFSFAVVGCLGAFAQQNSSPQGDFDLKSREKGFPQQSFDAETEAVKKSMLLKKELQLSEKQHKKVYDVIYKEMKKRQPEADNFSDDKGHQGSHGGPTAGMPLQGAGRPEIDDRSDDMHPKFNRPPKELSPKEIQTSQLKTRKKFKKILSPEQYEKWLIMESNKPEPCPERPMMKQ